MRTIRVPDGRSFWEVQSAGNPAPASDDESGSSACGALGIEAGMLALLPRVRRRRIDPVDASPSR